MSTLSETLRELRDALRVRDILRGQLHGIDEKLAQAEANAKVQRRRDELTRRLAASDEGIARLRQSLVQQSEEVREHISETEQSLQEMDEQRREDTITDASYEKRTHQLRERINTLRAHAAVLEAVCTAETAPEMDRLRTEAIANSQVSASDKTEALMRRYTEGRPMDWPGASIPERLGMVWRDSRKPRSRRPILISAGIIGVLTLAVIAIVLTSGASRQRDVTDFLTEGEVLVPVHVENAEAVREMTFRIAYDPERVTGVSVVQSEVGRLAVMQYEFDRSGYLSVTIRDVTGVSGSGEMLIARFRTGEGAEGRVSLTFTFIEATDALSGYDIPVYTEDGWIDADSLEVSAPIMRFTEP